MQPNCRFGTVIFSPQSQFRRSFALWALLPALLTGCTTNQPTEPEAAPFANVRLRVATPEEPAVRALLNRHARAWADRNGATIELVAADSAADVRVVRPLELGRVVERLQPLAASALKGQEAYGYSQILHYQSEHNMDWGGQLVAVPLMGDALFCVYRADLFQDPRHDKALQERFRAAFHRPLRPSGPATWQEVVRIAEYFAAEPNWVAGENAATPRPSLPPLPSTDHELDREFHTVAAPFVRRAFHQEKAAKLSAGQKTAVYFNYHFDVESGAPLIAGTGFVAATELLQTLQTFRHAGTAARPLEAFRSGKAVFALATLADLAWLQESDSAVRDRFGICRVPGSDVAVDPGTGNLAAATESDGNIVPYLGHGGWLAGIDAGTSSAAAAQSLLMYLSSPPVSLEVVYESAWAAGPTRLSHLDSRAGWHNYGLSPARTAQLVAALDGYCRAPLLNPAYRLRIAAEADYVRTFAQHLRPALVERQPARSALRNVIGAWDALAKDREALRREYRLSLGLR